MNLKKVVNQEFGEVRVLVTNDDEVLFVANDIAKALDYSDVKQAIEIHCKNIKKYNLPHHKSTDKTIEMNMLGDGDVIRLIINSTLPNAMKFEAWIFEEVVPRLVRTGKYEVSTGEFDAKALVKLENKITKLSENYEKMCEATKDVQKAIEEQTMDDNKLYDELNKFMAKTECALNNLDDRLKKVEGWESAIKDIKEIKNKIDKLAKVFL